MPPSLLKKIKRTLSKHASNLKETLSLDSASSSSSTKYYTTEITRCLTAHNENREAKGLQPLQWSEDLCMDAECYAQKLARKDKGKGARMGVLEHSGVIGQGENLFVTTEIWAMDDAVWVWMEEGEKYKGEVIPEGVMPDWGHYTQCMWHSTTHVGMGYARASRGGPWYVVARYTPPGNIIGQKPFESDEKPSESDKKTSRE